ncbi:MAG: Rrf2 family transcriptional regulator [Planctomycetota bacterium]
MNSDFAIALHIVGFLTARSGQPLTSEVLARSYGTSPVVVRRILIRLQAAGIVRTQRGVGGGTVLAQPPDAINLRQVYHAIYDEPNLLRRHPGTRAKTGRRTKPDAVIAGVLGDYINSLCDHAELAMLRELEAITARQLDAEVRPRICEKLGQAPAQPMISSRTTKTKPVKRRRNQKAVT